MVLFQVTFVNFRGAKYPRKLQHNPDIAHPIGNLSTQLWKESRIIACFSKGCSGCVPVRCVETALENLADKPWKIHMEPSNKWRFATWFFPFQLMHEKFDLKIILPETNILVAPENEWLEDVFPFLLGWLIFRVLLLVLGNIILRKTLRILTDPFRFFSGRKRELRLETMQQNMPKLPCSGFSLIYHGNLRGPPPMPPPKKIRPY